MATPGPSGDTTLSPGSTLGAHDFVVSSLLSTSEIITLLEERDCKNLTSQLNFQECSQYPIGTGGFGDVYSCKLEDGKKVAIKTVRSCDSYGLPAGKYQKRAAKELYAWSKCDHSNVAKLLGLAEFRGRLAMISDWAENGSLPAYLRNDKAVDRCKMSGSICDGLAYLHEQDIVHGDLKGANILVSDKGAPLLTDFGNASIAGSTVGFTTTASPSFSLRWAAPEILMQTSSPSKASDVYALGMTILETITGQVPFPDAKDLFIPRIVIDKKKTPQRPEALIPSRSMGGNVLWSVLMRCWARKPQLRPDAAKVRDFINLITLPMLVSQGTREESD